MKHQSTLWFASFLFVLTACAPASESARELADRRAEDEAAIRALRAAFLESQQAGDAQRNASFYAEDAVIMPPSEPSEKGVEAIRTRLARFYEEYKWSAQEPIEELQVRGDWAFTRTTWSASQTDKHTGVVAKLQGKAVHAYRRQPDGTWKIAMDIFNYDHFSNRP